MKITGNTMIRIIAVIAVVVAIIFAVNSLINGVPILEIFTQNPIIWVCTLICVAIAFFTGNKKS